MPHTPGAGGAWLLGRWLGLEGGVTRLPPQSLERSAAPQKRGQAGTLKAEEEKQTKQDLRGCPILPAPTAGFCRAFVPAVAAAMPGGAWALALALMLLEAGNGQPGRARADRSAGALPGPLGRGLPRGTWDIRAHLWLYRYLSLADFRCPSAVFGHLQPGCL